jgi:hypothetical protein
LLNYVNYFTEIETRSQQRRGSVLLLSTIDWALIETWREAGIPLDAVLRGIDAAFDRHDQRAKKVGSRVRKVNGLAWCAQAVMQTVEEMHEAAVGGSTPAGTREDDGFERERLVAYLNANADALERVPEESILQIGERLRAMAQAALQQDGAGAEDMEAELTALESRLFAALTLHTSAEELLSLREGAARELAPYRGRMSAVQMRQVTEQWVHKRLLEARGLPRLSLFYMSLS